MKICIVYAFVLVCFCSVHMCIAAKVIDAPDMTVHADANAEGIQSQPHMLGNALSIAADPRIDLKNQGGQAGLYDMSILGSAFSGAGLAIAGLNLSNPQTEHFNAALPIALFFLDNIRVETGIDQAMAPQGHLVGTVASGIHAPDQRRLLSAGIGEYDSYWLRAAAQQKYAMTNGTVVGAGAFADVQQVNQVNYEDNDVDSKRINGLIQWQNSFSRLDLLGGVQKNDFGARGYYGTNPDWVANESIEDALFLANYQAQSADYSTWNASAMLRHLKDEYTLHLPASLYFNEHKDITLSGQMSGRYMASDSSSVNWGVSAVREKIDSSSLGNHIRDFAAVSVIPAVMFDSFILDAGVRQEVFEGAEPATLPQLSLRYAATDRQNIRLAYTTTIRQPSFTELNYESPSSLGNQGLKNQRAEETHLQWTFQPLATWHLRASLFNRETHHTVDWIRETSTSTRWTAADLGRISTLGAEGYAQWNPMQSISLTAGYAWLDKSCDADIYSSRYAMDYARHAFKGAVSWDISKAVTVRFEQTIRLMADNPLRTSGDTQWDGMLACVWHLPKLDNISIDLSINNLWDEDFQSFPGQDTASPRRFSASVNWSW